MFTIGGATVGVDTVIGLVGQMIVWAIFVTRLDSKIKSQQEMSDYKFLANAKRIEDFETETDKKFEAVENRLSELNNKYDSLNREVLNKLSEIEKLLARLQGQFHFFDKHDRQKP